MENQSRTSPPEPVAQPKLVRWLQDRRISGQSAADAMGMHRQQLARYCLPFTDKRRQVPRTDVMARIVNYTGGDVTAADFYPAHLNPATPVLEAAE